MIVQEFIEKYLSFQNRGSENGHIGGGVMSLRPSSARTLREDAGT